MRTTRPLSIIDNTIFLPYFSIDYLPKDCPVSIENNKKNIEYTCDKLPVVSKNMVEITDNIKDISEVATDFTADAIVTKENIINNYDMVKEIFKIIKSVFIK